MNRQETKLIVINGTSGFPSLPTEEENQCIKENIDKKTLSRLKQKLAVATAILESFSLEIRGCLGESVTNYIGTSMNNVISLIEHEACSDIKDMDTEVDFKNAVVKALLNVAFEINEEMSAVCSGDPELEAARRDLLLVPSGKNIVYLTDSNIGVIENLLNQEIVGKIYDLKECNAPKKYFYTLSDKDRQEETKNAFVRLNYWRNKERKMKNQLRKLEDAKRNIRAKRYPM